MKPDPSVRLALAGVMLALALGACTKQQNSGSDITGATNGRDTNVAPAPDSSTYMGAVGRTKDTPAATASAAGADTSAASADAQGSAGAPLPSQTAGNVSDDARNFMTTAAQDGLMEVQAGKLASNNAHSQDIKSFAQEMVRDHSQANDELTQLAQRKGVQLPTSLDAEHQAKLDKLQNLKGAAFDREYSRMMSQAHTQAVKLFQQAAQNVTDPDVKSFAQKTLPTLRDHLKMAQGLPPPRAG